MGGDLRQADPRRFQPFSPLGEVDDNAIPFAEAGEPRSFKGRDVHEHVLAAAVPSDKAVAPLGVKPFHRSGLLDQRIGRSGDQRQRLTRSPLTDRLYPQAPPSTTRQLNAPNASRCCLLGVTASGMNAAR